MRAALSGAATKKDKAEIGWVVALHQLMRVVVSYQSWVVPLANSTAVEKPGEGVEHQLLTASEGGKQMLMAYADESVLAIGRRSPGWEAHKLHTEGEQLVMGASELLVHWHRSQPPHSADPIHAIVFHSEASASQPTVPAFAPPLLPTMLGFALALRAEHALQVRFRSSAVSLHLFLAPRASNTFFLLSLISTARSCRVGQWHHPRLVARHHPHRHSAEP